MRVYNSNTGKVTGRRRIGDFNKEVQQFKKSFSSEEMKEFRDRMFTRYGILINL